jgi:prophage regulatory protein
MRSHVQVVAFAICIYALPCPGLTGALQRSFHEGHAMTRKLVSKKELKSIYGIPYCFAHIARLEAASQFPKRVQLGACRVAWVAEEVEGWIEERVANRAQTSPS